MNSWTTTARRVLLTMVSYAAVGASYGQADPAIAYVARYGSKGKEYWDLTVMNADGTNRKVVWSRKAWIWSVAWSPDLDGNPANGYRGTLAIAGDELYPPGGRKLWLLDVVVTGGIVQGANLRVLVDGGDPLAQYVNQPAWSPDLDALTPGYQGRIAYSGAVAANVSTINLIPMVWDGAAAQPLYGPNSSTLLFTSVDAGVGSATWSPEGTRLAVKQGGVGVVVLDPGSGSVLATVAGTTSPSDGCDWQRTSGLSVIALRNADQLHTMNVDAGISSLQAVPAAPCADHDPSWSPDDRFIAFSGLDCGTKKKFTIRRTDLLTGQVTTLAAESGKDLLFPDWRRF